MKIPEKRSGYTHFVGVPLPAALAGTVGDCRTWMNGRYGCLSGYRTPPHVTLVPPFAIGDAVFLPGLVEALGAWASGARPFEARVSGFGAFGERTVFIRVLMDAGWADWHRGLVRTVAAALPGFPPPRKEPFIPHLTVANRDIPAGAVAPALRHFAGLGLEASFPVDRFCLFAFRSGAWEIRDEWSVAEGCGAGLSW